jgi:hypothetical protein
MLPAQRGCVCGPVEGRVDRDTRHADALGRLAERLQVNAVLLARDEVALRARAQPEAMHIVVRHHHRVRRAQPPFPALVSDHLGGEEMRVAHDVGIERAQELDQRLRVQPLREQPQAVARGVSRRPIRAVVQHAHELGRFVDEVEVALAVETPERPGRQRQHVDVADVRVGPALLAGQLDRLGGAQVARAGRCRQHEQPLHRGRAA